MTSSVRCVDAHAHLVGIDRERHGCIASDALRRKLSTRAVLRSVGASLSEPPLDVDRKYVDHLYRQLDRAPSVDRVVIFAFDGVYRDDGTLDLARTSLLVPNERAFEVASAHPKLWVGASVNPLRRDATLELERCAARGAVLVKWIPAAQGFDPADDRCLPFYAKLVELGLPLVSHVGTELALPTVEKRFGTLDRLERPLAAGVRVIVPHAGDLKLVLDGRDWDALTAFLARHENLLLDESALGLVHRRRRLFRLIERQDLHRRVIHGSDFPLPVHPWAFATSIGFARARTIGKIESIFEKDVALKRALGAPDAFFSRACEALRVPRRARPEAGAH